MKLKKQKNKKKNRKKVENSNYSFNLVCRFKSFNLIRRTVCRNTCIGMTRMWCFILSKCVILRLTPAHVHVYVHFSKAFKFAYVYPNLPPIYMQVLSGVQENTPPVCIVLISTFRAQADCIFFVNQPCNAPHQETQITYFEL